MKDNYTGKEVYIGIDVHKKTYSVCCYCDGEKVKSWSMVAEAESLIKQLKRYFVGSTLNSAYEAGFSGFALHRQLCQANIANKVVNPGSIEVASRDRVKTDKRDAKKLAEQLSNGQLESIHIPSEEQELSRLLTRHRATLIKDRARLACRIKSKLMQFGYWGAHDTQTASRSWIVWVQSEPYSSELSYVIQSLCQQWLSIADEIKQLDKKIVQETRANTHLTGLEILYRSCPGLGNISSQELSRELGDMSQFRNKKQSYSYFGLTPSESSSGERQRRGGISHCGRPRLRHLLIEIAWRSIKSDGALASKFDELTKRVNKKRAIVAIARILVGRLRACLMNGELYCTEPLETPSEQVC